MSDTTVAKQVEKMLASGDPPDWIRTEFPELAEVVDGVLAVAEDDAPGSVREKTADDDTDDDAG